MAKFNYKKWVTENKYGKGLLSEQTGSATGSATGSCFPLIATKCAGTGAPIISITFFQIAIFFQDGDFEDGGRVSLSSPTVVILMQIAY